MQTKKLAAPTTSSSSRVPSQQSAPLIDPPPCCSRCTPGASWPRKYRSPQGRTSTRHSNHVRKLRRRIRRWMSRRGPAPEVQAQTRWTTLKPGVRKRTPSLETVIPRGDNVPAERAPSSRWDCTRHLPEMRYNHLTPHAHHPFPHRSGDVNTQETPAPVRISSPTIDLRTSGASFHYLLLTRLFRSRRR